MAKFCTNCGVPLKDGQKFCTECGAPVAKPAQMPLEKESIGKQPASAFGQSAAPQPQEPMIDITTLYVPKEQRVKEAKPRKKGKGGIVALIVSASVLLLGAVGFFGFRSGGWFRRKPTVSYNASAVTTLREYAEQLERNGNTAAAEAVYEQLGKAGANELREQAKEDTPIAAATDEIGQFESVFDRLKGGGAQ